VSPLPRLRIILFVLSFVAGYVDACTFLALFGLFVAQVTGSFVTAGTGLVEHQAGFFIKALAVPVFLVAAAATTVLASITQTKRQSAWPWVLGLEVVLLIAFLWIGVANSPFHDPDQPAALMAGLCGVAAMGVQSAAVRLLLHGAPSTNVMTINLTQLAIDAAQLLLARSRTSSADGFLPRHEIREVRQRLAKTAGVMSGFFVGVVLGGLAFRTVGLTCLVPVIGILLCLVVATWSRHDRTNEVPL
jgi:uncharacterized membrane protein YoaK (UPF0700 family)